jgi:hypothetical protein
VRPEDVFVIRRCRPLDCRNDGRSPSLNKVAELQLRRSPTQNTNVARECLLRCKLCRQLGESSEQSTGELVCGVIAVTDAAFYANVYNGSFWTGWEKVGGKGVGSPSDAPLGTGKVVCLIMGPTNTLTSTVAVTQRRYPGKR